MSVFFQDQHFSEMNSSIIHGFFGSQGGVSKGLYSSLNCGLGSDDHPANVRANRVIAMESIGLEKANLHNVYQIHSAKCIYRKSKTEEILEADALVTDEPGQALSILTADCAPVLFQGFKENKKPIIGAAHAGWKGAFSGVLENTIETMIKSGAVKSSISAVVGPTIGPHSYEVGEEFKSNFISKDPKYEHFFKNTNSKVFFDLPTFCKSRLKDAGIENAYLKNLDTFFHEEDFFSYRRSSHRKDKDYGRQISIICIT